MAVRDDQFEKLSRRLHRIQSLLYVGAAAIVILASLLVYGLHQNSSAISQVHGVQCNRKQQLEHDIKTTENFLRTHPQGIPGVPNKLLLQGLKQNKAQLKTLEPISCS